MITLLPTDGSTVSCPLLDTNHRYFFRTMVTRNRIGLSEKHVALAWQQVVGRELTTVEGARIVVIYPGMTNGDKGPDFRDVVLATESGLAQGDIEVHSRSSDWYRHRHHCDAEYNAVILHVVMYHDCDSPILLQSGKTVPVLCLAQFLQHQLYLLPYQLPCFRIQDRLGKRTLAGLLNSAGEQRFEQKAMHFQAEILRLTHKEEAEQVLFRAMTRALGYARNMKPFEELADRTPLRFIGPRNGLAHKQALLLGTAGLLPSQRLLHNLAADEQVLNLEQIWQSVAGKPKTMKEHDWSLPHTYPNNSPVRRIVALSYLLERYCEGGRPPRGGLLSSLLRLAEKATPPKGHRLLQNALVVVGDEYWRNHFDFDVRSKTKTSALLGNGKAGEIAVNILLPFVFALGRMAHKRRSMKQAMELYRSYPKLAENEITRHMAKQLCLEQTAHFTACHQQGLIHIFRNYCREGACSQCLLVV